MAEPTNKIQAFCQELMDKNTIINNSAGSNIYEESQDVGQLIFEFFDEVEEFSSDGSSCGSHNCLNGRENVNEVAEDEEEDDGAKAEAAKAFWDSQEELLLTNLRRTTSFESKIRQATKEILMELNSVGVHCDCRKKVPDGCRKCTRKEVCNRLQKDGFSCTICKSKWRSSQEIPAGEHTYIEVVQSSNSNRCDMKVIIELNFKSEFMMARACEEYSRLINRLPDVYVGKNERFKTLLKILCSASKKCMKECKMHMAPWRKHKYMQAKWLGKPEKQSALILPEILHLEKPSRPKSSMLTFDLLDNLPGLHRATMIKVV